MGSLVVPEVNGDRALEHDGIVANPNCCTIPLTCALEPLRAEAGLASVRVATYQSVSGAGARSMERLLAEAPGEHDLRMDWEFDQALDGNVALFGELIPGNQREFTLAMAFATRPRLLLVDELSLGLAPAVVAELLTTIRQFAEADTTIVCTQTSMSG